VPGSICMSHAIIGHVTCNDWSRDLATWSPWGIRQVSFDRSININRLPVWTRYSTNI